MNISPAAIRILHQLEDVVVSLNDDEFRTPLKTLSSSSLGQHLRHTLEFFICLEEGMATRLVNYDKRSHDPVIETDRTVALEVIRRVREFVADVDCTRPLKLEASYAGDDSLIRMDTNVGRELVYNIEHAVHHMAIMKIGIRELKPDFALPADFGVAASTLRFKNEAMSSLKANHVHG